MQDLHTCLLIFLGGIHQFGKREHTHHYLLRQCEPSRMVESYVATVSNNPIDELAAQRHSRRVTWIYEKERFDFGILELFEFCVSELKTVFLRSMNGDEVQTIVLEMRQLKIGREDGCAQCNGVARTQQAIHLQ